MAPQNPSSAGDSCQTLPGVAQSGQDFGAYLVRNECRTPQVPCPRAFGVQGHHVANVNVVSSNVIARFEKAQVQISAGPCHFLPALASSCHRSRLQTGPRMVPELRRGVRGRFRADRPACDVMIPGPLGIPTRATELCWRSRAGLGADLFPWCLSVVPLCWSYAARWQYLSRPPHSFRASHRAIGLLCQRAPHEQPVTHSLMVSFGVVMGREFLNGIPQLSLIEEDHLGQCFRLDGSHKPFRVRIQIRTSRGQLDHLHTC